MAFVCKQMAVLGSASLTLMDISFTYAVLAMMQGRGRTSFGVVFKLIGSSCNNIITKGPLRHQVLQTLRHRRMDIGTILAADQTFYFIISRQEMWRIW